MGSTGGAGRRSGANATGNTTRVQYTDRNGNPIGRPVTYRQGANGVTVRQGRRNVATGAANLTEIRRNARNNGNRVRRG